MKRKLVTGCTLLIVISAIFLGGCNNSSIVNLGKAFSNSANVKSYSMDTSLSIAGTSLQNIEVNISSKGSEAVPDNAVMAGKISSSILGQQLNAEMYLETNKDFAKSNFIVKLPSGIGLPNNFDNKYLAFSGKDIMSLNPTVPAIKPIDANKQQLALELQKNIASLILKYYQADATAYKDIEVVPNVNISNPEGTFGTTKYTLSIDDNTLKKAIKYYLNTASNDDNFYAVIKDCLALTNTTSSNANFKEQFLAAVNSINKSMDDANFTILGNKGATISFYVNSNEYIAKVEGSVDFTLDNVQKQEYTLNFSSNIYGINSTTIEKPLVNSNNSYTLADLEKQMGIIKQAPTPAPVLNKKIVLKEKIVNYKKIEYVSLDDVKANYSINVKVDKKSKYVINYNNKLINVTPYKVTHIVYVKHKKNTIVKVYLPVKALKSLGLVLIDKNILAKEKFVSHKQIQYISLTDVKRNTSITVHVDKKSKYVVNFDGKSIAVTPYKVTHFVYVKHKRQAVVRVYLPTKALKDIGLVIKNI